MIEYYPWSKAVFADCLRLHDEGLIPTIDIELTAKCTKASCIYCDSKPEVGDKLPGELNYQETEKFIREAKDYGLKWIYACGLGEPFEDSKFERLVDLLYKLDINISIFTNGMFIDREKAKWLYESGVNIILKLDTFDESKFDYMLGGKGKARKIYDGLNYLLEAGYGKMEGGLTNLALSIVPIKLNYNKIGEVINFAKENNIFPSIGELEQAGEVLEAESFSELALTAEQIETVKGEVGRLLWKNYKRPICPSIITGVHIDYKGECVVEKTTGLNCTWFLLERAPIKIIGSTKEENINVLYEKVMEYRRKCFEKNKEEIEKFEEIDFVFGGCGGNPKEAVKIARGHL